MRKKLPSLVQPTDYYPLLLFQVGSDDLGRTSLRTLKKDFRALGRQVKGSGAQVVFSSILPAIGNNEGLDIMGQWINSWLRAWCARQGFGFFDLGSVYMSLGRLAADSSGFSHRLRGVLGQVHSEGFKLGKKGSGDVTRVTNTEPESNVPVLAGEGCACKTP